MIAEFDLFLIRRAFNADLVVVEIARASPKSAGLFFNLCNDISGIDNTLGNGAIASVQVRLQDVAITTDLVEVNCVTVFVLGLSGVNSTVVVETDDNVDLSGVRVVRVRLDLGHGDFGSGRLNAVETEVLQTAVDEFLSSAQKFAAGGVNVGVVPGTSTAIADQTKVDVGIALALQRRFDSLGDRADMVSNISLAQIDVLLNYKDDIGFLANGFSPGLIQTVTITADIGNAFIGWRDRTAQMDVGKRHVSPD